MLLYSVLTWPVFVSISFMVLLLLFLHTPLKEPIFTTVCILLSIGQTLSWGMARSTISSCLFCRHFLHVQMAVWTVFVGALTIFNLSNIFVSVRLFSLWQTGFFGLLLFLPSTIPSQLLSLYFPLFGELHNYLCQHVSVM